MKRKRRLINVALLGAAFGPVVSAATADIIVRNSPNPAGNAATRDAWLADIGITLGQVQQTVDFESGFSDGQNVSGVDGLFPAGLVIRDTSTAQMAIVRSTGFGGSNPVGTLSLGQNERPYLELSFPLPGVDYLAFQDIDQAGTHAVVHFSDGTSTAFDFEVTGSGGNTAEFVGIFRNDRAPIVLLQLDASGDGAWGIDTIMYGSGGMCDADFNGDGKVNSQDFFDFLGVFFVEGPGSDFNRDGMVNSQDFFDFLAAFFEGC